MVKTETLGLAEARVLIDAAVAKASQLQRSMAVAVVGVDAYPIMHVRMDNAWIGSIDIAIDKAFTAKAFEMPSASLGDVAQPGMPAFGIQHSNGGRVMAFKGGRPVYKDGGVVGAIGVSGGVGDEDEVVAKAAIAVLNFKGGEK